MSGDDARSGIEREYEEAVETARTYLRTVGVLKKKKETLLEREAVLMRDAILRGAGEAVDLPMDPCARHAAALGRQYLHQGGDARILEVLLEKDCIHPAYREALQIVVHGVVAASVDVPEGLQRWEKERGRVSGRRTSEATRNYLIGLVVEAMATGYSDFSIFFRHRDTDRGQLERDLMWVYANAEFPPGGLLMEDIVAALNSMKGRQWRKRNNGNGLTETDLSEFVKQSSAGEIHGINPTTKVHTCFPKLCVTRNHGTRPGRSICDAVAEALGGRHYDSVVSAWKRFKKTPTIL